MSFHTVRRGALVSVSIGAMACTSLFEMGCGATDSQGAQRAQGVGGATDSQGVGGLAFSSGSAGTCDLPGATEACFDGNISQINVGTCVPGQRKCLSSGEFGNWGPCIGAVNPSAEVCGDGLDTNCDGVVDDGCVALACDGISPDLACAMAVRAAAALRAPVASARRPSFSRTSTAASHSPVSPRA